LGGDADEAGDDIKYIGKGVSRDELSLVRAAFFGV